MSIIVKGMEMPTDCRECRLMEYHNSTGKTWCAPADGLLAEDFRPIPFDGRPDWCPLVALPEKHSDLIDRNVVKKAIYNQLGIKGEEYLLPTEKVVFKQIVEAEAVVEAEDE